MMALLSNGRPDDEQLVQYLLGTLPEADAERVDELSIADDEVAWRLRAVENDLVDAYVLGQLSGSTLEHFTSSYLASPVRRQRVELAKGLQSPQFRTVVAARPDVGRHALPQWALAAAMLIAVVGAGYFALENQRLRDEVSQAEAARAAVEQKADGLQSELERQRSTAAAARDELARLRESVPAVRVPSLRALLLLPLRRGAGEVPTVRVPRGVSQVPLRLRLETDDFSQYEAALRDPGSGQIAWRSGRLAAGADGSDRHVAVNVPVAPLRSANYTLELTGFGQGDTPAFVNSYAFRVVLE
jgi:hypothetical protein